ncbi:DUF3040 domain-containing protein [Mycolicibacterium llatzerense]|uniref:DUF3040 domain-containing protein n=1 Tax=Mycolicibacterium llatzerense TaxID=280871 RepID=UPI0021B578BA|nr:DUF3040 domain-containing protein [Mycolicibacterium llatzerense]MCT7365020.1 hypothetical protein [Mycolicibacterium llatzerense]
MEPSQRERQILEQISDELELHAPRLTRQFDRMTSAPRIRRRRHAVAALVFVVGAAVLGTAVLIPPGIAGGVYVAAACGYAVMFYAAVRWVTAPPKAVFRRPK